MALLDFSDADLMALKELVRLKSQITGNLRGRSRRDNENEDHQAPEVYIVLTPEGGIPIRSNLVPGSADCTIQHLAGSVDSETIEESPDVTITVFNISTTSVAGGTYILVKRDKFGHWIADVGGSSGGSSTIRFQILDCSDCAENCVTAEIKGLPCNNSDYELDEVIDVHDAAGCFFNVSPVFLLGSIGFATSIQDDPVTGNPCDGSYGGGCHWEVISLCGTATCP